MSNFIVLTFACGAFRAATGQFIHEHTGIFQFLVIALLSVVFDGLRLAVWIKQLRIPA